MSLSLQENERSKDVIIDHRFHKQIIGTKGEKIREIRDRFNGVQVGGWGSCDAVITTQNSAQIMHDPC